MRTRMLALSGRRRSSSASNSSLPISVASFDVSSSMSIGCPSLVWWEHACFHLFLPFIAPIPSYLLQGKLRPCHHYQADFVKDIDQPVVLQVTSSRLTSQFKNKEQYIRTDGCKYSIT